MINPKQLIPAIFTVLMLFGLIGCGGSSGSSGSNNESNDSSDGGSAGTQASGVFVDAPVEGLEYEIEGERFITDDRGVFNYEPGQEISFYIGDIFLGSTLGHSVLTPLDLVPLAVDESDQRVINRIRLLQTLDDDGNLSNGIQISAVVRAEAAGKSLDFSATTEDFKTESATVISQLTTVTSAGARVLVAESEALAHFRNTLVELSAGGDISEIAGTVISEAEAFALFLSQGAGIWLGDQNIDFITTFGVDLPGSELSDPTSVSASIRTTGRSRFSLLLMPETEQFDACGFSGPEPATPSNGIFDTDAEDVNFCDGQIFTYKRTPGGGLGLEVGCDNALAMTATWVKVSSVDSFDQGTLAVSSSEIQDLNSSDGVCGLLETQTNETFDVQPLPNDFEVEPGTEPSWRITIRSPYQGGWLTLLFNFDGEQAVGSYSVGDIIEADERSVSVNMLIEPSSETSLQVVGGSVDIAGVSLYTVNGTYDLLTSTGNSLTGSFSLNMR